MAGYWTFRDYVDEDGENVILAWLNGLPVLAKAEINTVIRRLRVMRDLRMPYAKALEGPCDGLFELRIESGNVQYRPLCCYGPGRHVVTILTGAVERGDKLVPKSACSTALLRKARIEERGRARDHSFG